MLLKKHVIYTVLFTIFTGCKIGNQKSLISNTDFKTECEINAKKSILSVINVADHTLLDQLISLDCREFKKIKNISLPYEDARNLNKYFEDFFQFMPDGIIEDWAQIAAPYCRDEHEWFGSFCMATDVHSASTILKNKDHIKKIPYYVHELLDILNQQNKKIDPIKTLILRQPNKKDEIVTIVSFLLLDDNGVQTSRLLANLLFEKRYSEYAMLFPYFVSLAEMTDVNGNPIIDNAQMIFYATRIGRFTIDEIIGTDHKLTYKIFSGVYVGCSLKHEGYSSFTANSLAKISATIYEFIKLGKVINDPNKWKEQINYVWNKSKLSREMMGAGAQKGHEHCSKN